MKKACMSTADNYRSDRTLGKGRNVNQRFTEMARKIAGAYSENIHTRWMVDNFENEQYNPAPGPAGDNLRK